MSKYEPLISSSSPKEEEIKILLDSLIVYIGGSAKTTQALSRIVYSNINKKNNLIIYMFIPKSLSHIIYQNKSNHSIKLVIQNKAGKNQSTLLDLSKSINDFYGNDFVVFTCNYHHPFYKNKKEECWMVAQWISKVSSLKCYSKKLFRINLFTQDIPYELELPSCWDTFVPLSREVQIRIESGMDEVDELKRMLKIWDCIHSLNVDESSEVIDQFLKIHNRVPNRERAYEVLCKSPLLMMMFVMFNCENMSEFSKLKSVENSFEDFIDLLVGSCYGTAVIQKTMKYLMKKIFELKLVEVKETESIRNYLLQNLGGDVSKYICFLHLGGSKTESAISCFFEIQKILNSRV